MTNVAEEKGTSIPENTRGSSRLISQQTSDKLDKASMVALAKFSGGGSPTAYPLAYIDWLTHLAIAPGKRAMLAEDAIEGSVKLSRYAMNAMFGRGGELPVIPGKTDRRFNAETWQRWPYNIIAQTFLTAREWWGKATTGVPGVSAHSEQMVTFAANQIVDAFSPSNSGLTNPEVHRATREEKGANIMRGFSNLVADKVRTTVGGEIEVEDPSLVTGRDLAITPGKVVFRNELIEVIQYSPATEDVYAEPILFVPAWIMKYYVLDLRPENSMYRYLVEQGHTVFSISWVNPDARHREIGMEDYLDAGVMQAIDVVSSIVPDQKIHTVGYCLGGTILSIAAAKAARDEDERIGSMTLFAAQTDFSEPGELGMFITEDQLTFLEAQMTEKGYMTGEQMGGSFVALRSIDLLWGRMVDEYLMGSKGAMNDLMTWNADTTRMPARMHSEYLRKMFLNNEFVKDKFLVDGKPVSLKDIRVPVFSVGTETDHVAPWKSAYKVHLNINSEDQTFALTSGGHNAGIVSQPGHKRRAHRIASFTPKTVLRDPDQFTAQHERVAGSWWVPWEAWLSDHSTTRVAPPEMGNEEFPAGIDAPGEYIHL